MTKTSRSALMTAAGVAGTCVIAGTGGRAFIAPRAGQAQVASTGQRDAVMSEGPSGTTGALYATGAVALAVAAASRPAMSARVSRQKAVVRSAEAEVKEVPVFDPSVQLG